LQVISVERTAKIATNLRVLLVDDSLLVRERVADFLSAVEGVAVVGQAADVSTGARLIRELRPDVVVLDINLAGENGMELLRSVKQEKLSIQVIMFTHYDHPALRQKCAEAGADYFFCKSTDLDEMLEVCRQLAGPDSGAATGPSAPSVPAQSEPFTTASPETRRVPSTLPGG
jgi:DNA-binding NarL/FixJ family response regulator